MKYDLHIHTYYSRCSNLKPAVILKRAKKLKLDGIAVTDHNSLKGALEVTKLNKDKNLDVIEGEEISTDKAHVLALYLQEKIKPGSLDDVLDKIKKQDGLAVIAHPFALGATRTTLKVDLKKIKNKINALETFNARCFFPLENKKTAIIAKKLGIAGIAGSDAHFAFEIGQAFTSFNDDLRKAIKSKKIQTSGSIKLASIARFLSLIKMLY